MEALGNLIEQNLQKESALKSDKYCDKCNEPQFKDIYILGAKRRVKVICSCQKLEFEEKKQAEINAERQLNIKRLLNNSLMDNKFEKSTFENWDFEKGPKPMHDLGMRYAEKFTQIKNKGLGLLIHGNPGNGKTYMVSAIANRLIQKQIPVICVSADALLARIKETYSKYGREAEQDIIRGLQNADLLIIDDLGAEQITEWSISKIYNIIDGRYRQGLPLIITSNIRIKTGERKGVIADLYGERTEDRILEMCTPVLNKGESIRVSNAKKNTGFIRELLYD